MAAASITERSNPPSLGFLPLQRNEIRMRLSRCKPFSIRHVSVVATIFTGCAVCSSWGWNASGTVKTSGGIALAGVTVSVKDSSANTVVTSASGEFSIGSVSALRLGLSAPSAWTARLVGEELEIQAPQDGPLRLRLVDGKGRSLWSASPVSRAGVARAAFPSELRRGAAFLSIQYDGGKVDLAVLASAEGLKVAPHLVASRAMASNPVLQFRKTGYRDTSYAMTSDVATGISVVMKDTTPALATCPSPKLSAGDQTKTITVSGVSRKFILHVPAAYTGASAVPLVVDFHPIGGSASGESGSSPYKAKTDPEGVITAYPDGLTGPMGQAWNVQGCCNTADDTSFARALVAEVKKVACIDPKRVYAVGFSMGGGMTHFAGCHMADLFAAGAPAAFDLTQQNVGACNPSRPLTMVLFRGTGDNVVSYAGGHSALVTGMAIDFLGAKASFAKWAELDRCTGTPTAEDANGCSTYSNCAQGVQVTLCTKQGGGHEAGNATVGWPILKKFTLP